MAARLRTHAFTLAPSRTSAQWIAGMRAIKVIVLVALAAIILVPRVYLWGIVPVGGVCPDEYGYSAVGDDEYEHPSPVWSFGPNGMPMPYYWLIGYTRHFWPDPNSIWSGRMVTAVIGLVQATALTAIAAQPPSARFLVAGIGCDLGTTRMAPHHRSCENISTALPPDPLPLETRVIVVPTVPSLVAACRERNLSVSELTWGGVGATVCGP